MPTFSDLCNRNRVNAIWVSNKDANNEAFITQKLEKLRPLLCRVALTGRQGGRY